MDLRIFPAAGEAACFEKSDALPEAFSSGGEDGAPRGGYAGRDPVSMETKDKERLEERK